VFVYVCNTGSVTSDASLRLCNIDLGKIEESKATASKTFGQKVMSGHKSHSALDTKTN
jgi:hypothetical protein